MCPLVNLCELQHLRVYPHVGASSQRELHLSQTYYTADTPPARHIRK